MPLSPGDKLGPYEILAFIGAGGMGEVWKARDTRLNRIVVVKKLRGEHSARFGLLQNSNRVERGGGQVSQGRGGCQWDLL